MRPLEAGRIILESDTTQRSSVAVLTDYGARRLLAKRNSIGENIVIGENIFKVVGIVKSEAGSGSDIQLPDDKIDAYVPLGVAREYYGDINIKTSTGSREITSVELHRIIVQVENLENVESTAKGIEAMLSNFHNKQDYELSVPLALLRQAEGNQTGHLILFLDQLHA